jgi:hypothetical protein
MPSTRLAPPTLCLLLATLAPAPAYAGRTESRLWLGAGASFVRAGTQDAQIGPAGQLGFQLTLSELWSLQLALDLAYPLSSTVGQGDDATTLPATLIAGGSAGVLYNLDVFTYIPFLGLALTGWAAAPPISREERGPDLGLKLSLGMLYRPERDWSLGAIIDLHTSLLSLGDFSLASTALVQASYHWDW